MYLKQTSIPFVYLLLLFFFSQIHYTLYGFNERKKYHAS